MPHFNRTFTFTRIEAHISSTGDLQKVHELDVAADCTYRLVVASFNTSTRVASLFNMYMYTWS